MFLGSKKIDRPKEYAYSSRKFSFLLQWVVVLMGTNACVVFADSSKVLLTACRVTLTQMATNEVSNPLGMAQRDLPDFKDRYTRLKVLEEGAQKKFEAGRKVLQEITQASLQNPIKAMEDIKAIGDAIPAKVKATGVIELPAHVLENIVNSNHFARVIEKRVIEHRSKFVFDRGTIVVPEKIVVRDLEGNVRELDMNSYWEKETALFFARAYIEEAVHAVQHSYTPDKNSYMTLSNPKVFDEYLEWLDANPSKVAKHMDTYVAQVIPKLLEDASLRLDPAQMIAMRFDPDLKREFIEEVSSGIRANLGRVLRSEMQEVDVVLWLKENGNPMRESQMDYHSYVRPLFNEFLAERR